MCTPTKTCKPVMGAIEAGWADGFKWPGIVLQVIEKHNAECIQFVIKPVGSDMFVLKTWNVRNLILSDIKPKQMENK